MNDIDQRLEEAGAEIRATAATLPEREAPGARRRTGARAAVAVAAVALGALFIIAPSVWLNGSPTTTITQDAATGGQPSTDVATDTTGFPYLLVDAGRLGDSLTLDGAFDEETGGTASPGQQWLWAFGPPDASAVSQRIWFVSVPSGSDFFRSSDLNELGWGPTPVEQGRAVIRTGPVGSSVMWETGDPGSEVIFAHGFLVDPDTLTDVVASLAREETRWVPRFLPDGYIKLYDGPARSDGGRLVAQSWADSEGGGEIELYLIDNGPDGGEQALNELLAFTVSDREIEKTDVRGKPALMYSGGNETVYQWMETTTVTVRLVIRDLDPASVLDALVLVDQDTWDVTMSTVMEDQVVEPVPTTVAPSATDS